MIKQISFLAIAALASPLGAEETAPSAVAAPVQAQAVQAATAPFLPANTEVLLRMNQELTTKGRTWSEGDTFNLSVVHDVMLKGYVVVPKGSRAVGRIAWLTSKGAFGKSGKMNIEIEYVEVGGRRIPLNGTYRQEGEGNTVATVGGVIAAGIFAGFITGKSATIPQGRELMATTEENVALSLPENTTSFVANLAAN